MIREAHGSLLEADADALVNTVNTQGVMGKGLALQFKRAYPEMFKEYANAAKLGQIQLGEMHVWETGTIEGPRFVINFPTKGHWRARSRLADIERGLESLVRVIKQLGISSIAVPPLGCGNGGLDWSDVEPRIRAALKDVTGVDVLVFPPGEAPAAADMRVRTAPPRMTPGRAALIKTLKRYSGVSFGVSLIEVQKLMYFLQCAGEPLRLNYEKGRYGPYADNLRHVLSLIENHYLSGYGDGSKRVREAEPLVVLPAAEGPADTVLADHPETVQRIESVMQLVEGFESDYGLELLASVHWIASNDDPSAADEVNRAVKLVQEWTSRKAGMFTQGHITAAWNKLRQTGWLPQVTQLPDP
ncbi:type II toxin-antitoxin system antitoxin DNA ADP-ribosyl glycohydrolase DarG [Phytoactinopolyspora limicola]|uniref:type II toxin-antitoxin system antitoxin DNA ADP-ribosyl glycohydrolase DarG n=1 Tax=Phytoactinopolyspora limicola TaxID=2715536 RepID=UPI001A9C7937|nr:macro domain-containing protein [Phytoactinopolyspora limicola]